MHSRCVRVFLSSTFRDFAEERDLLVRKIFPELRRRARDRNVEVIDIDLRWGITPEQAERGEVLPICLAEIDRARPYFFGFIGDRYGWVPEANQYDLSLLVEQPWVEEHRGGKSVTELEMLHGVLNNPAMAGRAFFYFRDTQYSQAKGGAYLSESEEHRAKLERLKTRIRESGFPVMEDYPSPEMLASRVLEDLWRLIDEAFPMESVPDPVTLERRKHEVYGGARLGLYLGGDKYFAALDEALAADPGKQVLITGPSGGGKSALVANWVQRYAAAHPNAWVVTHYLGSSADAADPVRMVYRIEREIAQITGEEDKLEGNPNRILQEFPEWLSRAGACAEREGRHWILVLDGMDKLSALKELHWWPSELPTGVKVVASCLDGDVQSALKVRMNPFEVTVHPLSAEDGRELIRTYLARFNKVLQEPDVERIVTHPLGGSPLFLRTVAEEMRVFGVHEHLQQRLGGYLESRNMRELFAKVLDRIEEDNRREDIENALSVLWGALESFAEDELIAVTALAPAVWSSILNALEGSLICNGGRISFGHDYMRKAVEDRYVGSSEKKSAVMRILSEFCAGLMHREGRRANSSYVRRQAVQHFIISEQWDEAVSALSDLEFIGARALALELPAMLIDYSDMALLLPEGEGERARNAARQAELDRYASEWAQHAAAWSRIRDGSGEAEPKAPHPVECVPLRTLEETTAEVRRITNAPNRLDLVKAFRVFVATNADSLERYSPHEGSAAALARNSAPAGPVHEEGKRLLDKLSCTKLIREFGPEETYNPLPALLGILGGHEGLIACLAFSLDGNRIVSGGHDGTIRIWDTNTGQCLRVLEGHLDGVQSLALSADGGRLVSLSSIDLRLWDTGTGQTLKLLENSEEWDPETGELIDFSEWHPDGASSVAISADGRWIVSAGTTLRVWDSENLELRVVLEGHSNQVQKLCFSEDGNNIVSASDDGSIRVWDIKQGSCVRCLEENFYPEAVALGADGTLAVGAKEAIHIFDLRTANRLLTLEGHRSSVTALALNADGTRLISGSYDKSLRVWDLRTGDCLRVQTNLNMRIRTVALSADGTRAISSGGDRDVWIWDVENGYWHNGATAHENRVNTLCFDADEQRLLSSSTDRTVRIWNPELNQCLAVFEGHQYGVGCATFSGCGNRVISGDSHNSLRLWDADSRACLGIYEGYKGPEDDSAGFSVLASNKTDALILSGSFLFGERPALLNAPREGMVVQTWEIETGRVLKTFHRHQPWVLSLTQGKNPREILSGSNDGTVHIWDAETGESIQVFTGHRTAATHAQFSPDGARIVSGDEHGILRVWERESGKCLGILQGHCGRIEAAEFSPDGTRIMSHCSSGMLGIWNGESGLCLGFFFLRGLSCVSVDKKWRSLAAGFADGSVRKYRLDFNGTHDSNQPI